jgi:uncharacterized protein YkwD
MTPLDPTPIRPAKKKIPFNYSWKNIRELLSLKNFTIVSIVFIFIGIISLFNYPNDINLGFFKGFFEIGIFCLILAYFLYAVKCWGSDHRISAILMISIPFFAYFLSTTTIPESISNIIFFIIILFLFYAIFSTILLYLSDKVKLGIERKILKKHTRTRWFFPNNFYILIGILFLTIISMMGGTQGIWTSNINSAIDSPSVSNTNFPSVAYPPSTIPTTQQYVAQITPVQVLTNKYTTLEDSRKSIEYINSIRTKNGLNTLRFDQRVYNIALARVNDMDKYGYLDHTNPQTGTCPDSIKIQYGLNQNEYVAENAYGFPSGGSYFNGIEKDAIDSWMTSKGHRNNLLYPHIGGAIACSNGGHCVFLGLNGDRFGEGCYTAAQGIAYWNSH